MSGIHQPEDLGVLRFITAGSVDDGKSTLIGRLLYDSKAVLSDQLSALSRDDMRRILVEPEHSLLKQYAALLNTENVTLSFTDDAVDALSDLAADINERIENIGARRLHTVLERLLEDISFTATDRAGETISVDAAYVNEKVAPLAQKGDLSRFIL